MRIVVVIAVIVYAGASHDDGLAKIKPEACIPMAEKMEARVLKIRNDLPEEKRKGFQALIETIEKSTVRVNGTPSTNDVHASGFIVDEGRYLLTAGHVYTALGKPKILYVFLPNGKRYVAEVVKGIFDDSGDLAICRIKNPSNDPLPSVKLAETSGAGENAIVAGFPKGLGKTSQRKVVHAKSSPNDLIAILNPGSIGAQRFKGLLVFRSEIGAPNLPGVSGGPLFNTNGEVIGVLSKTAFLADGTTNSKATPIETVRRLLAEVRGEMKQ